MKHFERISTDPAVCHGKPVIKGTRVPVTAILAAIAGGDPPDQVASDYGITIDDVRAAVAYAAEIVENEQHFSLRARAS